MKVNKVTNCFNANLMKPERISKFNVVQLNKEKQINMKCTNKKLQKGI